MPMPSSPSKPSQEHVDVVIVTAIREEYAAVLLVGEEAWPDSHWEERPGPLGHTVAFRDFRAEDGGRLRVAVTWATKMGQVATTGTASSLVETYSPRCLAMCGVCAGRKGKVELGDVIIADLLWEYDFGKLEVEYGPEGARMERFLGRQISYRLDTEWKHQADALAESFEPAPDSSWLAERPRTYEAQEDWVLQRLEEGTDPREHKERSKRCADFAKVLQRLRDRKYITSGKPQLTAAGSEYITQKVYDHPDGLPESRFRVRVGPIATGNKVIKDEKIFERLSERDYQVLGLEMEAAAIGALAELRKLERMVVMKGVMDFADPAKNDNFKEFAARASAECLMAFLRRGLPSVAEDSFEDLLETGTDKRPEILSPTALLNGRYGYVDFSRREEELKELAAWCEDSEPVRAWLYHGAGGMGKTRLLSHWCGKLRERHWVAGLLGRPTDESRFLERFEALLNGEQDALVVIDYAESRQNLGTLMERVARRRTAGRKGRFRLVLLARTAGGWFEKLQESSSGVQSLLYKQEREIRPLVEETTEARQEVFREAARCFARELDKPDLAELGPGQNLLSHERRAFPWEISLGAQKVAN
jgi:nucleoside phosphorylase